MVAVSHAFYSNTFTIDAANISDTEETNVIRAKKDPGLCDCDLTALSCDAFCCCDWDCRDHDDEMSDAGLCLDEDQSAALPLQPCVDVEDIRQYNIDYGDYSYAGPITRLTCVIIDTYPPTNEFYLDVEAGEITEEVVNDLQEETTDF